MNIPTAITRVGGRLLLKAQKFSPEICAGVGVVGIVAGVVMCCNATLKVNDILDESAEVHNKIERVHATHSEEEYSEKDYKRDLWLNKVQTGGKLIRAYAPSIAVIGLGIGFMLGGQGILKKRNAALVAAYKGLEKKLEEYQENVESLLKKTSSDESIEIVRTRTDEDGKSVIESCLVKSPLYMSQYAVCFDECNPHWEHNPILNKNFVMCQQNWANDRLKARGHLFLNEVYDMLGFPHTKAGAVVGWVLGNGDDIVDFGLYSFDDIAKDAFLNGEEPSVWLDFNVDGVIYDLI